MIVATLNRMRTFTASLSLIIVKRCLHSYPTVRYRTIWKHTETLLPYLGVWWQPRNKFHLMCNICLAKRAGDTVPFKTDIRLLDKDGRDLGYFSKIKATNLAVQRDLVLRQKMNNTSEIPTYQLMSKKMVSELGKKVKEVKKVKSKKQRKTLTINSTIEDQSLNIKLKSLDKWLEKGKDVTIVIKKAIPGNNVVSL